MYESLTHFLRTFSAESPLLWAFLVMVIVAVAGLALYGFWEVVLRGVGMALGKHGGRNHHSSGRGGH